MGFGGVIKSWFRDLINIILPKFCLVCEDEIVEESDIVCIGCLSKLPYSRHWESAENDFTRRVGSRFRFEGGAALFLVRKGERVQKLIQMLKYQDREDIGIWMGEMLGYRIKDKLLGKSIDFIIPVPLHPRKLKSRGYNQSLSICHGLAKVLGRPVMADQLLRVRNTISQTKINKEQRLLNIAGAFSVREREELRNKHILLVDDVLTTGATMEACALSLLEIQGLKVSLATAGLAEN